MSISEHHIARHMLNRFCVIGVNYNKADVTTRGQFSVNDTAYTQICIKAKEEEIKSIFVVSTCNRTELYGFVTDVRQLVHILTTVTESTEEDLFQYGYTKTGLDALTHLFQVAAGLDSQILGDYEILGQLKRAIDFSRSQNMIGPIMDRIINFAFQASKKIKTDTLLSNGTVSVSYAAIELLLQESSIYSKKILLLGTGKFGINICKNLNSYLKDGSRLFVTNRTNTSAQYLAAQTGATYIPYENSNSHILDADVVIVCTNATDYTIRSQSKAHKSGQLILDLSVPANVHPDIKKNNNIRIIDVDEISTKILDKTIAVREAEVPKATQIINTYIHDYMQWLAEYHYALHIKSWRKKLKEIDLNKANTCEMAKEALKIENELKEQRVQKAVKRLAVNLKSNDNKGCQFISSINDFLHTN